MTAEVSKPAWVNSVPRSSFLRFFLGWSANHTYEQDRLWITLTQEEIGEMIGVSRETVSRLLTAFRKKKLLAINGACVNICNRAALRDLAGT